MKKWVVVSIAALLMASSAQAGWTFAADTAVGGGSELLRLPSWDNSDNAAQDFKDSLSLYGVESFEVGFSDDMAMDGQTLTFGGIVNATFSGSMTVNEVPTGTNGLGRYPTDGDFYLEGSTSSFSVAFEHDITAFGFYGIDIGDYSGQATVELYNGGVSGTLVDSYTISLSDHGSVLFLGYAGDKFDTVVITNSYPGPVGYGDGFGFDEMVVGQYIPAPGAILLGGIGTGILGLLRRRKVM